MSATSLDNFGQGIDIDPFALLERYGTATAGGILK
jgi:hypothetical protein